MPSSSRDRKGKGKAKDRPVRVKKVKQVLFDEDARKEYLTGFSKRKKAREAAVRNKAIERERQERLEMRAAVREERRQRAAENVRQAQIMFGGGEGEEGATDDDDDDEDDDDEAKEEYETADLVTTVSVEPFSLSRSASPDDEAGKDDEADESMFSTTAAAASSTTAKQQQTKLHKKRVKNAPQARPKMSRADKKARATGNKGQKKKLVTRMRGTKGKAVK